VRTFMVMSRSFLLRMRNVSEKGCRENQKTHFTFSNIFSFENRVVHEIMWKSSAEPDRPQIIFHMFIACWIHTLRLCNTYCFSTATAFARPRLHITLYVLCLSCLKFNPVVREVTSWL